MKIGLHGKEYNRQTAPFIECIFQHLHQRGAEIYLTRKFEAVLHAAIRKKYRWKTFPVSRPPHADLFFSIGGDGTLLESVTYVGAAEIPILGINTGRLGFLATIGKEEIDDALTNVFKKEYTLDKRSLLRLESNKKLFGKTNFALNDFTLVKKDSSSMITVHTYIDGEFLNSYWADGIIVSTPTGSTGYSLSCGGPLVFPRSGNFIITPVSPHNLTVRPIIVSDSCEISFRVEGRSKKFLISLDSRFEVIDGTVKLMVRKEDFKVNLIQLKGKHYFNTIRQKLNWGLDIRN
jgi:NAD+ kinase